MLKIVRHCSLGEYLRSKREEAGLSQGDLAKMMGYTTNQFVSNWERGLCSPPLDGLARLIKELKLDKKELAKVMIQDSSREIEYKLSEINSRGKLKVNSRK